jgi:lysophospholipase L1-like esterase
VTRTKAIAALLFILTTFGLFILKANWTDAEKSSTSTVYEKINLKQPVHYLIIGDSIGRGAGAENKSLRWFSQWETLMKEKFGTELTRYSIVQSGATAFEGIYKYNQEKKEITKADLIVLIFGENDRKYMNANQFARFYEALIRQCKKDYPLAELMTVTESSLENESFAKIINTLSRHYDTIHVDMRIPFKASNTPVENLTVDSIHPNGAGYKLYAQSFLEAFNQALKSNKKIAYLNKRMQGKTDIKLREINKPSEIKGDFTKVNGTYSTTEKNASLSYQFTGSVLGVKVLKGITGGEMDVYIDGKFIRRMSTWWPIPKERVLYVTSDLVSEEHKVTFVFTGTKSRNNKFDAPIMHLSSIIVPD